DMLHWMFWEQYNHEPNIATLRFWKDWIGHDNLSEAQRLQIPLKREAGEAALKLMNDHLQARDWIVGTTMSLADICLFAYTHVAEEGGFELSKYPRVQAWIERVKGQPHYIPMNG
ncbi:MAG: glutathione binding-like protein, partial [Sphingomonas sp.]